MRNFKINSILKESADLMAFYDYEIISADKANQELSKNILLAFEGRDRRIAFDERIRGLEVKYGLKSKSN